MKDLMATVVQVEATLRRETGLNLNQSFALCCLAKGSLSAGALADELRIRGASLSRIIKTLDHQGYIYRDLNSEDNRQKLLTLTDAGHQLALTLLGCEARIFPLEVKERGLAENQ